MKNGLMVNTPATKPKLNAKAINARSFKVLTSMV